jgi:hypothetical protein
MIPVTQTKFHVRNKDGKIVQRGNCFAAVVASFLEVTIHDVPNTEVFFFEDKTDDANSYWSEVMHTFLNAKGWEWSGDTRYKVFHPEFGVVDEELKERLKDTYYLVIGQSARGVGHVCIYQNGVMVHDPHPSRDGLETVEYFESIERI